MKKSGWWLALAMVVVLAAASVARAAAPPLPGTPQVISVIDVGGGLSVLQTAIEAYQKTHPALVSRFVFTKAPAPELPAKLTVEQSAGRVDIDIVLSGFDAINAGIEQGLYVPLLQDYADRFPDLEQHYLPGALKMQQAMKGYAIALVYTPSGPLLEYDADRVKDPPYTTDELLAWCQAHPRRFAYARPANSGPGHTLLEGLPYLLGDRDPGDPVHGWDKTWASLKQLDNCIDYYPSGTGAAMRELGDGTSDIISATVGWDIYPRVLGIVAGNTKVAILSGPKGFTWLTDALYMAVPKGVPNERLAVALDLIAFLLQPAQQALTYDSGYFYPGPAVTGVPLAMAPAQSRDLLARFGRPEYDEWIAKYGSATPPFGQALSAALETWDKVIGANHHVR